MQFFYWVILLMSAGIAMVVVQNPDLPPFEVTFLMWRYEISFLHTILGSIGAGFVIALSFWIPRAFKSLRRFRELKREIENLEKVLYAPASIKPVGGEMDRP
jgi:uncharacterized integral membrane protein